MHYRLLESCYFTSSYDAIIFRLNWIKNDAPWSHVIIIYNTSILVISYENNLFLIFNLYKHFLWPLNYSGTRIEPWIREQRTNKEKYLKKLLIKLISHTSIYSISLGHYSKL